MDTRDSTARRHRAARDGRHGAALDGHSSDYQEVDVAYRFGSIELVAGADTYRLVPIDYVGEGIRLGAAEYLGSE